MKLNISIPILGVIWITSVTICLVDITSKIKLGIIGRLSWVAAIVGFIVLIIWGLTSIKGNMSSR